MTQVERSVLTDILEVMKAEYRGCSDPKRCDRLDLAMQWIERKLSGRQYTLDQYRAFWSVMDDDE